MEPSLAFADTPQTRALRLGAEVQKAKRAESELQLKTALNNEAKLRKEVESLRASLLTAKLGAQRDDLTLASFRKDNERLRAWMHVDTHFTLRIPRPSQFNYHAVVYHTRRAVFNLFYLMRELIWPEESVPADVSTDSQ